MPLRHSPLSQAEVIGLVEAATDDRDVVVGAAGSLPGDLHKLWRARDPKGYHVEYAYSCMGYEVAAGLGVKMADPSREVIVMVGDGSWLMMSSELVTALAEGIKLVVVLVVNHGFASIGNLSESVGVERFGTRYRYRTKSGLDGATLPVDLAANAASLGARVLRASTREELASALADALAAVSDHGGRRRDRSRSWPRPTPHRGGTCPVAEVAVRARRRSQRASATRLTGSASGQLLSPTRHARASRLALTRTAAAVEWTPEARRRARSTTSRSPAPAFAGATTMFLVCRDDGLPLRAPARHLRPPLSASRFPLPAR